MPGPASGYRQMMGVDYDPQEYMVHLFQGFVEEERITAAWSGSIVMEEIEMIIRPSGPYDDLSLNLEKCRLAQWR